MLIGLHGKIGAGKDTVAEYICEKYFFTNKKFAHNLKYITSILTGCDISDCYSQEGKNIYLEKWGMTIGEFQQKLGTDAIRNNLHKDAWVISSLSDYTHGGSWIFSDVRFPNELEAITSLGGISIKIERPVKINHTRNVQHESETALDHITDWRYVIYNDGSLEDLYNQVDYILEDAFGGY